VACSWLEFIRFAITGGVSTLVDLGGILLAQTIGCRMNVSVSFGYLLGLIVNFLMHKYFTFNSRETVRFREVSLFLSVGWINGFLTLAVVNIIALIGGKIIVGKLLSLPLVVAVGYMLNKKFVFRA
jgi:putative flippase GtrA